MNLKNFILLLHSDENNKNNNWTTTVQVQGTTQVLEMIVLCARGEMQRPRVHNSHAQKAPSTNHQLSKIELSIFCVRRAAANGTKIFDL
jgi:hypothetical protein